MEGIKEAFSGFTKPSIAIDTVLLRTAHIVNGGTQSNLKQLQVLLVKKPDEDKWHLPGTILRLGESSVDAINRIVDNKEFMNKITFEQLYTVDDNPLRDDRGHIISIVYIGMLNADTNTNIESLRNGYEAEWFWVGKEERGEKAPSRVFTNQSSGIGESELMYDHSKIINDTLNRLKGKLMYAEVGFNFIGKEFTISELENTFDAINEREIPGFRRYIAPKIKGTGKMLAGKAHRPAEVYTRV